MSRVCVQCHGELPDEPGSRCPRCLVEAIIGPTALGDADGQKPERPANAGLPGYELIEEIARGGMGVVYKARQASLNRVVALKLILSGRFASKQEIQRFRSEAEAAAHLRHPNIVPVYEMGEHDGQHFFSMEYVPGRDLATVVREGSVPTRRAAQYVESIACAIQHAHEQGILHRDLKPSNVLIDRNDQPRITDFGLAKRLIVPTSAEQSGLESAKVGSTSDLTLTGQALGSPNFMPPEQASTRSGALGPWSDVYGTGAILYHLLTGRPPFQADTIEDVLRQLHEQDPVPPRSLNPSIPADLETICLKCLEKEPGKRYPTARELADELAHFLHGEPIQARRLGPFARGWRWCRRKPVIAALLAALLAAIMIGAGATLWQLRRVADTARQLRAGVYASGMNLADRALAEKNIGRAVELLQLHLPKPGEEDLRGFEWRYLWNQCRDEAYASIRAHEGELHHMALSADGHFLATTAGDHAVKLWELPAMRLNKTLHVFAKKGFYYVGVAMAPDGKMLAATDGETALVWELPSGREIRTLSGVDAVQFLPRRHALQTQHGDTIQFRDTTTWEMDPMQIANAAGGAVWSPDERWLAVLGTGNEVSLLDAKGKLMGRFEGGLHNSPRSTAFSPDGKFIAAADIGGQVHVWNRESLGLVTNFQAQSSYIEIAFSPDSRFLATGGSGDHYIRLWNVRDWRLERELVGHLAGVDQRWR